MMKLYFFGLFIGKYTSSDEVTNKLPAYVADQEQNYLTL